MEGTSFGKGTSLGHFLPFVRSELRSDEDTTSKDSTVEPMLVHREL